MNSWQRFLHNPILLKEMEVRSRKPERYRRFNYAGPALHLLILCVPLFFFIVGLLPDLLAGRLHWARNLHALRDSAWLALGTTLVFQLLYFMFNSASFTSGSLTVEKEQNTYDLLMSIPVSVPWLVTGKLAGSLAPLIVEVVASLPVYAIYCLAGGISLTAALKAGLLLLLIIYAFGAFGLYVSARNASTVKAHNGAKNLVLAFLLGPFALAYAGIFVTLGYQDFATSLLKFEPYYLLIAWIFPVNAAEMVGWFDVAVIAFYVILPLFALNKVSSIISRLHRG